MTPEERPAPAPSAINAAAREADAQDRAAVVQWLEKRIAGLTGTRDAARMMQQESQNEEALFRHCRAANDADNALAVLKSELAALQSEPPKETL